MGEAEAPDDVGVVDEHERPGGVHLLCGDRMAPKPPVELVAARIEVAKVVCRLEAFEYRRGWAGVARRSGADISDAGQAERGGPQMS